ncbi:MAG: NRDE family protein [Gammaproteobacteria bacterium]|nr:MAG: NRDE family protein [Gammaproteobacteria bacterium]
MCLIAIAWQCHPRFPLVLAANRDEFHARPTAAVHRWNSPVGIIAGRDLEAGGTWLGASPGGRIAALTNVREPASGTLAAAPSRGELPVAFLADTRPPAAFAQDLADTAARYRGFNLLLLTGEALLVTSNRTAGPVTPGPGVHALSNAPPGVDWPKTRRARDILGSALADNGDTLEALVDAAFGLLADPAPAEDFELPESGLPTDRERQLSAIFVAGSDYGTRCSSVLVVDHERTLHWHERRFGPDTRPTGSSRLQLAYGG